MLSIEQRIQARLRYIRQVVAAYARAEIGVRNMSLGEFYSKMGVSGVRGRSLLDGSSKMTLEDIARIEAIFGVEILNLNTLIDVDRESYLTP